jgi:hypothetical protein
MTFTMNTLKRNARIAGFLYLLMAVTAPFSLMYIPGKLIIWENAAQTASNILASQTLFRLSIIGELLSAVIFLFLVMVLYRLFSNVDKNLSRIMAGMVLASVAITFVNDINDIAALVLIRGGEFLSAIEKPQRDALAMLFINLHGQGHFVNEMFWGLWLFPFGILTMKSKFIPQIFGILLLINGLTYIVLSLTWLLKPEYGNLFTKITMPALFGELWIILWFLIKGVREPKQVNKG